LVSIKASGPLIGWMIDGCGAIFVDRGGADVGAMRAALEVLEQGHVLLLAPEGTRNKVDHSLQPAQKGLGMMVRRTNPVLMPVAIWGTPDFPGAFKGFRYPRIHVRFGEPYRVNVPADVPRREADAAVSDLAMQELAADLAVGGLFRRTMVVFTMLGLVSTALLAGVVLQVQGNLNRYWASLPEVLSGGVPLTNAKIGVFEIILIVFGLVDLKSQRCRDLVTYL